MLNSWQLKIFRSKYKCYGQFYENKRSDRDYKTIYLPGLNGLRAITVIAVVISHITLGLGSFGLNNKIFGTDLDGKASGLKLAGYGVTIFYVEWFFNNILIAQRKKKQNSISKISTLEES